MFISVLGDEEQRENTLRGLAKAKALSDLKSASESGCAKHRKFYSNLMNQSTTETVLNHCFIKFRTKAVPKMRNAPKKKNNGMDRHFVYPFFSKDK